MMCDIALDRCKFCGGASRVWEKEDGGYSYRIYCKSCYATTPWRDSPDAAADIWNRCSEGGRKKCPCCGSDCRIMTGKSGEVRAVCRNKGCGLATNWCKDKQQAIDKWQRRVQF